MRIQLKTEVSGYYKDVMAAFDRDLFEALKPSGAKMEIVEFTGSRQGDRVHLRFLFPFKMEWISDITEDGIDAQKAYFIDKGVKLPPGLKNWEHHHIVEKIDHQRSRIIDDMRYEGPNKLVTWILYPLLFIAFYPRKKVYRSYFKGIFQKRQLNS